MCPHSKEAEVAVAAGEVFVLCSQAWPPCEVGRVRFWGLYFLGLRPGHHVK